MVTAAVVWDTSSITWEAGNEKHYLATGSVQAEFGQPLDPRVTIHSDKPSPDFAVVLLYLPIIGR